MQYYSKETENALTNFPFPLPRVSLELIYAVCEIKKASALANSETNLLDNDTAKAITAAADEVLAGKMDEQFVTCSLQGGAGTSINMNVNEVLAARATEISGKRVHPNDHVNLSQSTNDVNPSALRIVTICLISSLISSLDELIQAFENKAAEFRDVKKLGRTHLQDAVPVTVGDELKSYSSMLQRDKQRIMDAEKFLHELNLGGTAIGTGINAPDGYRQKVYDHLKNITALELKPATNLMSLTAGSTDFVNISTAVNTLALDLSKISNDLRLMSSGPAGGFGEIFLQPLQAGSSIMPGKVNPVMPESMNQIYYYISGKNLTILQASEASFLELSNMFPVIADSIITSIKLVTAGMKVFSEKCIRTMNVNRERCLELLEKSTAYATLLTPVLGYDKVSQIVKEAVKEKKTIREVILQNNLLSVDELSKLIG